MKIAVAGEILWDVFPSGEHLGGASFNFAVNAHRLGHDVTFISAVGNDRRGWLAIEKMKQLGLSTASVRRVDHPTGTVTVEFHTGEPDYTIHRPAAYDFLEIDPALSADWVYFGTLAQVNPQIPGKRFYDVNLRQDSYTLEFVDTLLSSADVVKMNEHEFEVLGRTMSNLERAHESFAITRGCRGCTVFARGAYADHPGFPIRLADPVGAGDAFAAAFLHGYCEGWPAYQIAEFANRAGAEAASREGAL